MKHILYTSQISNEKKGPRVPDGLLDIYSTAKQKNVTYGVTGLLAYHAGNYLQVIEGPDSNINNLYQNILHDPRHKNIRILAEGKSVGRYFASWRFESGAHLSRNQEFERFFHKYEQKFKALPQLDRDRLAFFFKPKKIAVPEVAKFENQMLRLKRWPEMHKVGQTTEVINLCASLLHGAKSYGDLVDANNGLDEPELERLLDAFVKQGVLETLSSNTTTNKPMKNAGSFYQKMRAFISASIH